MGEVLFFMALSCLTLYALLKLPLWGTDSPPGAKPLSDGGERGAVQSGQPPSQLQRGYGDTVPEQVQALLSALRGAQARIKEPSAAASLGRICSALEALAEHAQAQPQDTPAVRRFLERYGETTTKLANSYAGLVQNGRASPAMRESAAQLKQMLRELADAHERFLLSLREKEADQLLQELELLRGMLARDGLDGSRETSASTQ